MYALKLNLRVAAFGANPSMTMTLGLSNVPMRISSGCDAKEAILPFSPECKPQGCNRAERESNSERYRSMICL